MTEPQASRRVPLALAAVVALNLPLGTVYAFSVLIRPLEAELGLPVITSNQVMAWHALRQMGISDAVAGYGRLMGAQPLVAAAEGRIIAPAAGAKPVLGETIR